MTATNDYGRGDRQWEAELHARFLAGDRSAAETLYRTHEAALKRLAVRFCEKTGWDPEEAISAAREAFVDFLPKLQPERARLMTALYHVIPQKLRTAKQRDRTIVLPTIHYPAGHHLREASDRAANLASVNWQRDEERPLEPVDTSEDPRDLVDRQEVIERVLAALETINPRDRQVLDARYREGATLREVATRLGVSRERVRQLQRRAIEKLRDAIKHHPERAAS